LLNLKIAFTLNSMTKPYFKEDNFCLYQGDSREVMKTLPENYVDMIFADPPYFLSNGGFTVHAGKMVKVDKGSWDISNGVKEAFDFHISWLKN